MYKAPKKSFPQGPLDDTLVSSDMGSLAPEYQIHIACALEEGIGISRVRGQIVIVEACKVKWLIVYLQLNHPVCEALQVCQDLPLKA